MKLLGLRGAGYPSQGHTFLNFRGPGRFEAVGRISGRLFGINYGLFAVLAELSR